MSPRASCKPFDTVALALSLLFRSPTGMMNPTWQLVQTTLEFEQLRLEWNALLQQTRICSPFLTWEWMYSWWRCYCEGDRRRRLAIVTARRGQELAAILPGYVRRGPFGLHTFALLGTEYESSDYLEVIQRPEETSPMLPRMLDFLVAHAGGVDVLHVSNVLPSRSILGDLEHYAESSGASHYVNVFKTCPFLPTEGMSWESYVAQLSPKMRKNLRRSTRQLIDAGAEFTLVRERARVRPGIAELFDLHARRFVSKHESTGFSAKTRGPFHADVSERLFDADILRLFLLRLDGRTIAALYCFEYGDTLFFFQSGFDPAADKLSAGTVLVGYAIKYAIEKGLACFDFMRGEEAYKFRWTSKTRQMFTARLGLTYRGRLYLAQEALISRAKKVIKSAAAARFRPVSTQQAEAS